MTGSAQSGISRIMPDKMDSRLNVPAPASLLRAIDDWRRTQPDIPARATAARRLIEAGLAAQSGTTAVNHDREPSKGK
jgi:hypothetical protein